MVDRINGNQMDSEDTEEIDTLALILSEVQRLREVTNDSMDELRQQVKGLNDKVHRIETNVRLIQHAQQLTGVCLAEMKSRFVSTRYPCGNADGVKHDR